MNGQTIPHSTATLEQETREAIPLHSSAMTKSHIRVVTTAAEFDALEPEWGTLLQQSPMTIFQTFEWSRTWWKYFGDNGNHLHILVFMDLNRVIGIAPLYRECKNLGRITLTTRLQFMGREFSDYTEIIILKGFETEVFKSFAHYLAMTTEGWDIFDIEDVNEESLLFQQFPRILESYGLRITRYQGNVCPQLHLPSAQDMLSGKPGPTTSYNFKRKFKKLQQHFPVKITLVQHDSDNIRQAVEDFSTLHGERWKSLGYPSAFDDETVKAFHVEFSEKFARRGWLRMLFLRTNGSLVAVNYGFHYNGRIYMYHSNAHGSVEAMKNSPGFIVKSLAMVCGIEEGMKIFDFLRGDEAYKYKEWDAVDTKNYLLRCCSPTALSRVRSSFFIISELTEKISARIQREYYEYRRFTISRSPDEGEKAAYLNARAKELFNLGFYYILRHLPCSDARRARLEHTDSFLKQNSTLQQ